MQALQEQPQWTESLIRAADFLHQQGHTNVTHWPEFLTRLSLRGGDVARNSDSAKVPTRNRNSERHVTSQQTVRVFEACVRNAGERPRPGPRPLAGGAACPELAGRRCRAEFRFREGADSESEFRATCHVASDGSGLRRECEKCALEAKTRPSATGGRCSVSSAAKACLAPNASPFWQSLPRHLPGHRRFGSAFRDISPALAVLAVTSETSPQPSPFWQPLPRHLPGHRRFGSRFRDVSATFARKRGLGEVNYRYSPKIG
jgi:hypothetical protein